MEHDPPTSSRIGTGPPEGSPSDDPTRNSAGIEGIQLASTSVSAAAADTEATVTACYTFTSLAYTMQSGFEPERPPVAAAAEFTVTYGDSWRLLRHHQPARCSRLLSAVVAQSVSVGEKLLGRYRT